MPTPEENRYAATTWTAERLVDLTVPSGQLCSVRRPGVEGLIRQGLLKKTDSLTSLVDNKHIKRVKGQQQINVSSLMQDMDALLNVMDTVDQIISYVVVQPHLVRPVKTVPVLDDEQSEAGETKEVPLEEHERQADVIYTDYVSIEDRMFIFQYAVGGSKDLEQFRKRFNESAGGLASL